ncbi:MAG: energy transducer TonB [Deltaproteobacteria bacterium]|nr:energy transducer TonB [Deltaproteobacteria bacterium]
MKWFKLLKELFAQDGEERRSDRLLPFLLASIFLHLLISALLPLLTSFQELPKTSELEVIPLIEDQGEYRIADIAKPAQERRPEKAKLAGMYDSSVAEESVSMESRGKPGSPKPTKKSDAGEAKDKLYDVDPQLFASQQREAMNQEQGSASSLDDYFPDFRRGAHTYLNVLRYPNLDYFVRMKRAFKLTFNPAPALRRHFLNNQVSRGSIDVVLGVSVDASGKLSELFVLRSSGVPEYDQEGLRTVRASAPFASPPSKFLANDGTLHMSWTFTVYL